MLDIFRFSAGKHSSHHSLFSLNVLGPLRRWLNEINVCNPVRARLICQLIPAHCPFECTVRLGNIVCISIPSLCKLNPLYQELIGLRFRALCYLAEQCAADICHYC